jgi:hypothetical protein
MMPSLKKKTLSWWNYFLHKQSSSGDSSEISSEDSSSSQSDYISIQTNKIRHSSHQRGKPIKRSKIFAPNLKISKEDKREFLQQQSRIMPGLNNNSNRHRL